MIKKNRRICLVVTVFLFDFKTNCLHNGRKMGRFTANNTLEFGFVVDFIVLKLTMNNRLNFDWCVEIALSVFHV